MRILFLTDNFVPEVNAPATRTYEHCIEWVKEGVDVTVITCAPNFPHGKVYKGYKNKLLQKDILNFLNIPPFSMFEYNVKSNFATEPKNIFLRGFEGLVIILK